MRTLAAGGAGEPLHPGQFAHDLQLARFLSNCPQISALQILVTNRCNTQLRLSVTH